MITPVNSSDSTIATHLATVAQDLYKSFAEYDATGIIARIVKNSTAIDYVFATEGLTPVRKATALSKLVFEDDCIDTGHPHYNDEKDLNWSTACRLPASCFVKTKNPIEVAVAVKIVTLTGIKFAVRATGRNPNPGFGSIDDTGICIDLSQLRTLELDSDQKVAHVGSGNKIGDVQKFMDSYDVGVVTGVNNSVGATGATLGGGFGAANAYTGLACDNVKNYEVVLSDSTIINANAEEHSDLFQCLKGGGNNFGIVTRLDLWTVPVHNLWYHFFDLSIDISREFLAALAEVQNRIETDPKASFIAIASGDVWHITLHYVGHSDVIPWPFEPLMKFERLDTFFHIPPTNGTVYSYNTAMTPKQPHIGRQPCSVTTKVDAQLYYDIFEHWTRVFPKGKGTGLDLCIKPFNTSSVTSGRAHGTENILGNVPMAQTWWSVLAQWTNPADKDELYDILESMREFMVNQAKATDNFLPYNFMNDSGYMQDIPASYGAKNLAKMKAVSQKYDVKQVFQRLQNGGFKVSKAAVRDH
ncbi:FAD binding domain protein [Aspergillus sclerotialis]|uniref:FAD binding domain protein n=1 Tax=Aspergillus sclerotialis TaxID=2070753 RepID=A0A3A2ZQG5_9EURO|nr:FAD binding domain protein [Aspergillus sclerotialis]